MARKESSVKVGAGGDRNGAGGADGGSDGLAMVPLSEWPESGYMCQLASQPAASALMRVPSTVTCGCETFTSQKGQVSM